MANVYDYMTRGLRVSDIRDMVDIRSLARR